MAATLTDTASVWRVYETVEIRWERGSRWSGYDRARALATIEWAETGQTLDMPSTGTAYAKAWAHEVAARYTGLYQPGIDGVDYASEAEAVAAAEARTGEVRA